MIKYIDINYPPNVKPVLESDSGSPMFLKEPPFDEDL